MVTVGLLVRLEAKPGKEADVENFLRGALSLVEQEPATITWYAIRLGPSTFGIFDTFPDDLGRQAHLSGPVAAALMANASELLSQPPSIEKVDILVAKLPDTSSSQQRHLDQAARCFCMSRSMSLFFISLKNLQSSVRGNLSSG